MVLGNYGAYSVRYVPTNIEAQITGLDSSLSIDNPGGIFSKQYGRKLIRANLIDLLTTRKGDRVMLPEFGTNLHLAVFEPYDEFLVEDIKNEVIRTVSIWEPRVEILNLVVTEVILTDYQTFHVQFMTDNMGKVENSRLTIELLVALKDDVTATDSIVLAF